MMLQMGMETASCRGCSSDDLEACETRPIAVVASAKSIDIAPKTATSGRGQAAADEDLNKRACELVK